MYIVPLSYLSYLSFIVLVLVVLVVFIVPVVLVNWWLPPGNPQFVHIIGNFDGGGRLE